jgi:acyl dehydratase
MSDNGQLFDTKVGDEEVSDWVLVDQQMIDRFAEATGDRQYIHVDPVRAKDSPFGGTIAHGFLTLSLLPMMAENARKPLSPGVTEVNYGSNKLRFLSPVPSGSRVRGRFRYSDIAEKRPGHFQVTAEATVEIEGKDKPALICEWIRQFMG